MSEIESKVTSLAVQVKSLMVTNNEQYAEAAEQVRMIKALRKEVDDAFDPIIAASHAAHKEAVAQKKKAEAPLLESELFLKRIMSGYTTEQERKRREEESRLQDLARRQAEKEQAKLVKKAEKSGDSESAAAIRATPVYVPPVVVTKMAPQVAGISARKTWKAQVVDAGLVPREYMAVDIVKLNQYARMMREAASLPGVKFYEEESLAVRA